MEDSLDEALVAGTLCCSGGAILVLAVASAELLGLVVTCTCAYAYTLRKRSFVNGNTRELARTYAGEGW